MKIISTNKYAQIFDEGRRFIGNIHVQISVPASSDIEVDREKAKEVLQKYVDTQQLPLDRVWVGDIITFDKDGLEPR